MSNILDHAIKKTTHFGPPNSKNTFHIALTGSTDYIPHLGIVASSIYEYNKDLSICYHFFVNYLTKEDEARLLQTAKSMNSPLEVHLINDNCFKTLLLPDGIAAFFYRLLIPPTIAPIADRVLYLDGDILCRGSLQYLTKLNFQDNAVAVVSDRDERSRIKRKGTSRYFNSGMMLINLKQWTKDNLFDDIVCRAETNARHTGKHFSFHDQDILNEMLDGKSLYIDKKYNYLYNLDRQSLFAKQPVNEDYKDKVIIHFAGHAKPWHDWVQNWDVVKEYAAIQRKTPWKDVPLVPPKGTKNLHQAARSARMYGNYGEMLMWYLKYLGAKL